MILNAGASCLKYLQRIMSSGLQTWIKSVAALYKAGGFRCPQLNSFNWFKIVIWLVSWIMTHDEQKPKKAWWDWKYSLYGILLVGLFTGYFQANVGTSQTVLFQERMSVVRLWDAIDGLTCTFWYRPEYF